MSQLVAKPKVYVASPLGFTAYGRIWYDTVLLARLAEAGLLVSDPWTLPEQLKKRYYRALRMEPSLQRTRELEECNHMIGERNAHMIRQADGLLAVLDGQDLDSGTVVELGYAVGLGKPVVALRTDNRLSGDNEATPINLQVAYMITAARGMLARDLQEAVNALAARVR